MSCTQKLNCNPCESLECKRASANTKKDFIFFVPNYTGLKDLKECEEIILKDGQLIYVSSTKEYVKYDADKGSFFKTNIVANDLITLP